MQGNVVRDQDTDMEEATSEARSPPKDEVAAANEEPWHRLRPQSGGIGVNALWRVEGVGGEEAAQVDMASCEDDAFTPSVLFVANRFGFDQGSEALLLRLVKDAAAVGWHVKVFAVSLRRVPDLENLPSVHITSNPRVFDGGNFDIVCIHMCDMQLLNPGITHHPLRFFVCPTNSTAGILGLRKPSRMGLGASHDASIMHLGVQRRSKTGIASMHNGPPPLLHPAGVKVDLIPMPSASNLLDHLRGEFDGSVKVNVIVEALRDYPSSSCEALALTVTLRGQEIFRSGLRSIDGSFDDEWDEAFSCTSKLDQDSDTLTLTVIGLTQRASTASDAKRSGTQTLSSRPCTSTSTEPGYKEIPLASGLNTP